MTNDEYDHVRALLTERASLRYDDPRRETLRDEAVVAGLPLAQHIAQRFSGRGENRDDLLQIARLGLVQAIDRFEPSRGADFLSFAVPTVMGEVRRHFRDRTAMLRAPRRLKDLSVQLRESESRMTQVLGRTPTRRELATDLGVDLWEVEEARRAAAATATVSLDSPAGGDDDRPTSERVGREDPHYDLVNDAQTLRPALAHLRPRERKIIGLRYFEDLPQSAIAKRMGMSQVHVSRLLRRSIADLQSELVAG